MERVIPTNTITPSLLCTLRTRKSTSSCTRRGGRRRRGCRSCGSKASGGGRGGGAPPRPPAPSGVGLPSVVLSVPPGVYSCRGGCRAAAGVGRGPAGRRRASAAGGRGGSPPARVRAPVFPRPASDRAATFAPSWAPPVRRRPAPGGACGRLPRPWCPRTPGAAASSGGVRVRRFFRLPPSAHGPEWEGGRVGGGALVPWRRLLTAGGGGDMAVPAPGASHQLGGRTLPPPPST